MAINVSNLLCLSAGVNVNIGFIWQDATRSASTLKITAWIFWTVVTVSWAAELTARNWPLTMKGGRFPSAHSRLAFPTTSTSIPRSCHLALCFLLPSSLDSSCALAFIAIIWDKFHDWRDKSDWFSSDEQCHDHFKRIPSESWIDISQEDQTLFIIIINLFRELLRLFEDSFTDSVVIAGHFERSLIFRHSLATVVDLSGLFEKDWRCTAALYQLFELLDRFAKMAEEAPRVVRDSHTKIILGVDRLDYTKGLVHRLKAFEILLQKYPELVEQVRMNRHISSYWDSCAPRAILWGPSRFLCPASFHRSWNDLLESCGNRWAW